MSTCTCKAYEEQVPLTLYVVAQPYEYVVALCPAELDYVPAAVARGDRPAARSALLQHRAPRGPHALEREFALLPLDAHDVRCHDPHHPDMCAA